MREHYGVLVHMGVNQGIMFVYRSANSCCANILVQNLLTGDLQLYFSTGGTCANTTKQTKLMLTL
jgi:hypothetical protein